jgi:hypothetical protein
MMRDETCRKPFCSQPAATSDLDHTLAWGHGGPTADTNLACLCEFCHQMKHRTAWNVAQAGGGVLDWTTPLGRTHTTRPAIEVPSTSPPGGSLPGDSPPDTGQPRDTPPAATTPGPGDDPPPF